MLGAALSDGQVRAQNRDALVPVRGPRGLVTVYSDDAGVSALLARNFDTFASDLAEWLRLPARERDVILVFRREDEGAGESHSIDASLPSAVYRSNRPVPRWVVLRDLVILDAMARVPAGQDRSRAAGVPDWLALGLAAVCDSGASTRTTDRLTARAVRQSGRAPDLPDLLRASADAHTASIVQALGTLLVRSLAASPAGRPGVARLLADPPDADEDVLAWFRTAFPEPAPDEGYILRWWALECVRAAHRFAGGRTDTIDLAAELSDALNPVIRTAADESGRALRVNLRELPEHSDKPWFPMATAAVRVRLQRVLLLAPEDLRPAIRSYLDSVRSLESERVTRSARKRFVRDYNRAEQEWTAALGRREAIRAYLDSFDEGLAGEGDLGVERLLDAMRAAAATGEGTANSPISRYLDSVADALDRGDPLP